MSMRRLLLTLTSIAAVLALTACGGSSSEPQATKTVTATQEAEPTNDKATKDTDAEEPAGDAAEEGVPDLPEFDSAYDAVSGKKFDGYWFDNTNSLEDYEDESDIVDCSEDVQEEVTGRDIITGERAKGTEISCWVADTDENVTVVVYPDNEAVAAEETCGDPEELMEEYADLCFGGLTFAVYAESNGALVEVLENMGVDPIFYDPASADQ